MSFFLILPVTCHYYDLVRPHIRMVAAWAAASADASAKYCECDKFGTHESRKLNACVYPCRLHIDAIDMLLLVYFWCLGGRLFQPPGKLRQLGSPNNNDDICQFHILAVTCPDRRRESCPPEDMFEFWMWCSQRSDISHKCGSREFSVSWLVLGMN